MGLLGVFHVCVHACVCVCMYVCVFWGVLCMDVCMRERERLQLYVVDQLFLFGAKPTKQYGPIDQSEIGNRHTADFHLISDPHLKN